MNSNIDLTEGRDFAPPFALTRLNKSPMIPWKPIIKSYDYYDSYDFTENMYSRLSTINILNTTTSSTFLSGLSFYTFNDDYINYPYYQYNYSFDDLLTSHKYIKDKPDIFGCKRVNTESTLGKHEIPWDTYIKDNTICKKIPWQNKCMKSWFKFNNIYTMRIPWENCDSLWGERRQEGYHEIPWDIEEE